jgi:hypothetical protein
VGRMGFQLPNFHDFQSDTNIFNWFIEFLVI